MLHIPASSSHYSVCAFTIIILINCHFATINMKNYYYILHKNSQPVRTQIFKTKWKITLLLCSKPVSTPVLSESPQARSLAPLRWNRVQTTCGIICNVFSILIKILTDRPTIYARFFAAFSSASTFWNSCISVAISLLNRSRQIRFGIAISAFAISEKFHARSSEVVAPMYTTRENMIR